MEDTALAEAASSDFMKRRLKPIRDRFGDKQTSLYQVDGAWCLRVANVNKDGSAFPLAALGNTPDAAIMRFESIAQDYF